MFVHFLGSRFGSMTEQTPGSFFNEPLFIFHRYLRSLWCNVNAIATQQEWLILQANTNIGTEEMPCCFRELEIIGTVERLTNNPRLDLKTLFHFLWGIVDRFNDRKSTQWSWCFMMQTHLKHASRVWRTFFVSYTRSHLQIKDYAILKVNILNVLVFIGN